MAQMPRCALALPLDVAFEEIPRWITANTPSDSVSPRLLSSTETRGRILGAEVSKLPNIFSVKL